MNKIIIILVLIALAYWANYLIVEKQEAITNTIVVEKPVEKVVEKIVYVDRPVIIERIVCPPKTYSSG